MSDSPLKPLTDTLAKAWFELLRWIALIAALKAVNAKQPNWIVGVVIGISMAFVILRCIDTFALFDIAWLARWPRLRSAISLIVAVVLALAASELAGHAVRVLTEAGKP